MDGKIDVRACALKPLHVPHLCSPEACGDCCNQTKASGKPNMDTA